jgi:hypothetical protein
MQAILWSNTDDRKKLRIVAAVVSEAQQYFVGISANGILSGKNNNNNKQ